MPQKRRMLCGTKQNVQFCFVQTLEIRRRIIEVAKRLSLVYRNTHRRKKNAVRNKTKCCVFVPAIVQRWGKSPPADIVKYQDR